MLYGLNYSIYKIIYILILNFLIIEYIFYNKLVKYNIINITYMNIVNKYLIIDVINF